jgi:hypothetical protein
MAYGTLKIDNITYTNAGVDASTTVSGLVQGQFPNLTITGTISGATITGNTGNFTTITAVTGIFTSTLSGATTTGITANFQSGVFTTQVSGATVAGPTHTGTTANFVAGNFTSSITGVTITGTTANFSSGNFTGTLSGATVTGNVGQFTNVSAGAGNFTSVTGTTVTGTTANFVSGNFTGTASGATVRDSIGNVRIIPQNAQTTGYTLTASDVGKHIFTVTGVTVPSGVFTVGDAISIYNNTTGNITITQGTNVTLRQAGASGTGDRTLAQRGLATVLCVSGSAGTEFVIGGAGLS